MRRSSPLTFILFTLATLFFLASPAHAAITITGDVDPSNSSDWSSDRSACIGKSSTGSLTINGGECLFSQYVNIGRDVGAIGIVAVEGSGSTWNNQSLLVGGSGSGILSISNGGVVSGVGNDIAYAPGSTGMVTVDGSGSAWNNSGGIVVGCGGNGTMNITNGGTVTSCGNDFQSTLDGAGCVGLFGGATGTVRVQGAGSLWANSGDLWIGGINSTGTLQISGGAGVGCGNAHIGQSFPVPTSLRSTGSILVDGTGSIFTCYDTLAMGGFDLPLGPSHSNANLRITNGGAVTVSRADIGKYAVERAILTVDGSGSIFTADVIKLGMDVGFRAMIITGGGSITTRQSIGFFGQSLLAVDVGRGSLFTVQDGTGSVGGCVRILAGASVPAGNSYTPISCAGNLHGQAVGGTLDTGTHQFTVSEVVGGTAGTPVMIDRAIRQRVLIGDSENSSYVGASFLAVESSSTLSFTATTMGSATVTTLQNMLGEDRPVLGAWDFATEGGYAEGDPAYLSFDVGPGYSSTGLVVWHYDGTKWTPYDAIDLTYDGQYASFTVTGFSGYAVAVPEPASVWLLLIGLALTGWVRRRR